MGILDFLRSDKNTRKVFGKRELKIIEKQLYGVALSQSEKNRLSRDIRKKLEFMREAARFSEEFELKKGSIIKDAIEEAKEAILAESNKVNEIRLYGSAAENTLTLRSDIDISVEFSAISLKEATLFRKRISGRVNPRIDIQVYNHLPEKIRKEIRAKGRVLYEDKR
ncbi:MAG TPA: nucleotidyltransferase domain-containing protein [Candidatus Nanoarchaeia archaeon]|nr:nucleotidyltransferase domain-containing protein [Candidatus Nanoarchaeia archaeon]